MTRTHLLIACALPILTGCGDLLGDDDDSSADDPCAGVQPLSGTDVQLVELVTGLEEPVALTHAGDGSGRLFVVEQRGRIQSIGADGTVQPYLDLEDRVGYLPDGERGLLSVAFHPDFARNGRLFVDYTGLAPDGNTFVSELVVPGDPRTDPPDPASEIVLLEIPQPAPNNNGGQLAFGPDGMLYIGTGDGGTSALGDPYATGQDPSSLLAKVLRIDVDGARPYAVPSDNPFVSDAAFRPEVWAWGFRNPWRFSFDRLTGELWLGDAGPHDVEEIDVVRPGFNGGWSVVEGDRCREPDCDLGAFDGPVWVQPSPPAIAIIGGAVYRGCRMPDLVGLYLFSDFNHYDSPLKTIAWDGSAASEGPLNLESTGVVISAFGEDEAGELYVLDYPGGRVLKIAPGQP